jgi:hypothetical protein
MIPGSGELQIPIKGKTARSPFNKFKFRSSANGYVALREAREENQRDNARLHFQAISPHPKRRSG